MSRKSVREQAAAFNAVDQANTAMRAALAEAEARKNARAKVQAKAAKRAKWAADPTIMALLTLAVLGTVLGLQYADAKYPQVSWHQSAR